jgi:hypothetical protein
LTGSSPSDTTGVRRNGWTFRSIHISSS